MALITEPGFYPEISAEDYHRNVDLLPGPSLSSSGAKVLLNASPFHYWFDSPLNPDRPPEKDKAHFNVGKAAHDKVLLAERWPDHYHVTPAGFSRSASVKFADAIAEAEVARDAGKVVLSVVDAEQVERTTEALSRNPLVGDLLRASDPEMTLAWQDAETGVWLRARPDALPRTVRQPTGNVIVPDLKFVAASHASPEGFGKAVHNFGYHMSAAFYSDGIKAVFGRLPSHWLHIAVEKDPPTCVALYQLPGEDIERGRWLNRKAINLFADCLSADRWPGYADEPLPVGLPGWSRHRIDEGQTPHDAIMAAA